MGISVYKILNKKTGKFYIGYSKQTEKRFRNHLNMLNRGQHHCVHLQRAWAIDGADAFEFSRVKVFLSVDDAVSEEQAQFDEHFKGGNMYNSVGTNDKSVAMMKAHGRAAKEKNTESKRNSSLFKEATAKNRLKALTPEAQAKRVATTKKNGLAGVALRKSVIARDESTGEVKFFESIAIAAKELGSTTGNVHGCCVGKRHRVKGHLLSFSLFEEGDEFRALFPQFAKRAMYERKMKAKP